MELQQVNVIFVYSLKTITRAPFWYSPTYSRHDFWSTQRRNGNFKPSFWDSTSATWSSCLLYIWMALPLNSATRTLPRPSSAMCVGVKDFGAPSLAAAAADFKMWPLSSTMQMPYVDSPQPWHSRNRSFSRWNACLGLTNAEWSLTSLTICPFGVKITRWRVSRIAITTLKFSDTDTPSGEPFTGQRAAMPANPTELVYKWTRSCGWLI